MTPSRPQAFPSSPRRALLLLAGLCFLTRLAYVLFKSDTLLAGGMEYEQIADNTLAFGRMVFSLGGPLKPTAYMPPGCIFLLILLKILFHGAYHPWLGLLQVAIAATNTGLVAWIAGRVLGPRAALWAAVLYVLDVNLLIPVAWVNETVYTMFFVLLYVVFTLRAHDGASPADAALAGLFLGVGSLFRSTLLLHAMVAAAWLFQALRRGKGLRPAAVCTGALLVAFGLVLLPWTWRNYRVFGKVIPVSQNLGINLWVGWSPLSGGSEFPGDGGAWRWGPALEKAVAEAPTETIQNRILVQASLSYAKQDPLRWLRQRALSFLFFWHEHSFWAPHSPYRTRAWLALGFVNIFFVLFFFAAAAAHVKQGGPARLLLLILAAHSFVHTMTHADIGSRYRYQIEPLMLVFVAGLLIRIKDRFFPPQPAA